MSSESLFQGVRFIADAIADDKLFSLLRRGATQYKSFAEVPGTSTIHLITEDYNSPLSIAAQSPPYNGRCVICTPDWVDVSTTKGKLQDVRRFSADPRQFFTGVCVTCSELSSGDKEAIYGGVLALGGQYSDALVRGTTHVVALTMTSDKVKDVLTRPQSGIEVVLPHWFDDCLRLRRRIPSEPYRFPHPRILLNNTKVQPPPPTSPDSDYRYLCDSKSLTHDTPDCQENIFDGKSIMLGADLQLGERMLQTVSAVLGSTNGVLARNIATADIYVGKYREGSQYLTAARTNKIVGNYTWILYCLARGKFSSPRNHLLHYPVARGGLAEFRQDIITVSNYTGEARLYLERLITALGAKFTRNMKPENTHLITAVENGEKYNTAKQWGIPCVNHLWLEESYAQWQKQAITLSHYVTFPRETNLMDVIAQTPILKEGIEPFYLESETDDEDDNIHAHEVAVLQDERKTLPPQNVDLEKESQEVELPDIKDIREFSSPLALENPTHARDIKSQNVRGDLATDLKESETIVNHDGQSKPYLDKDVSQPSHEATLQTPTRGQGPAPSSRGSTARKASQQAASKLKHDMEDANKFGQQMRNKHKLPLLPSEMQPSVKRRKDLETPVLSDESVATTATKVIKAVMTGCPELTEDLHSKCEKLGIEFVEDPVNASHLIAPRIARTKKFVVAIAACEFFVHWDWLLDSVQAQKLLPESSFPPEAAPSAPWSKNLAFNNILERAKGFRHSGGFLAGLTILISDAVTKIGGFETYRDIVEVNGGTCGLVGRRGTDTKDGRVIMIADGKGDPAIHRYLQSLGGKNGEKNKENRITSQAGKAEVYDREWLMTCSIRQELLPAGKSRLA
ncbi:BRCT domain protein [Taphrina deformans PYCC 5710]|uniref:BRCT domain protein n=1 Tax=Taphrina deformans (strain PYCC 5710 / ATCC 11124 / CBS 356.35 / IMI 108563 / JCM 9778 / NBRC 8474) TaxID=1097556 RepID=R4X8F6_TAPDE|nr:BRCT domain protein [Taphrina deformans PYCC 5710]|eukprot:CCG81571.1 BRCT domain protein [Taphrina deformans PYCC 5710]